MILEVIVQTVDDARAAEDGGADRLEVVRDIGVGAVPGSSFYSRRDLGHSRIRFAFPKRPETLDAAAERLARLRPEGSNAAA